MTEFVYSCKMEAPDTSANSPNLIKTGYCYAIAPDLAKATSVTAELFPEWRIVQVTETHVVHGYWEEPKVNKPGGEDEESSGFG